MGIDLPYSCRAESLGWKNFRGTMNQEEQSFLDDDQLEEGLALLIVAPFSDCVIRLRRENY